MGNPCAVNCLRDSLLPLLKILQGQVFDHLYPAARALDSGLSGFHPRILGGLLHRLQQVPLLHRVAGYHSHSSCDRSLSDPFLKSNRHLPIFHKINVANQKNCLTTSALFEPQEHLLGICLSLAFVHVLCGAVVRNSLGKHKNAELLPSHDRSRLRGDSMGKR